MRIAAGDYENHAAYIRHARTETLRALGIDPHPTLVQPVAISEYVFGYDDVSGRPVGMTESAMLRDVYGTYNEAPYARVGDLTAFCPLHEMGSMRTVYVEPQYRNNSSLFLTLLLGSVRLFQPKGARFATATTRADDPYLNRLYTKLTGIRLGTFRIGLSDELSSLFVFDLAKLLRHRAMRRVESYLNVGHKADIDDICEVPCH